MRALAKVDRWPGASSNIDFLRPPPFPGSRVHGFEMLDGLRAAAVPIGRCVQALRQKRVGGSFWASQPALPKDYVLARSEAAAVAAGEIAQDAGVVTWLPGRGDDGPLLIRGECDPWHMLSGASALFCDAGDELRLVATLLGVPVHVARGDGRHAPIPQGVDALLEEHCPAGAMFANPFGGAPLDVLAVIDLCGHWRALIDSNRPIVAGVGFASWKQESVLPLLWGGQDATSFFRSSIKAPTGAVAVWRTRTAPETLSQLDKAGVDLIEVEDGFLRSNGLGADCVAPLSITVDRLGAYFDPAQPSELELILQNADFDGATLARARRLRETIVAAGLGKYERGEARLERFHSSRKHILVPGQVEDDRSILTGGGGLESNLELLRRVRAREPDAYIIYKPHPDVVAGHRKGDVPDDLSRTVADRVEASAPIASLIAMVDAVHVNTSLAGFEALMRHKQVTTHGVPFYAGWGLTEDLGTVPARRSRQRSLDELVAATLLLYPRYYDPVSRLPCPAEVVVERLTANDRPSGGLLVAVRRIQGRLKRSVQRLSK